MSGGFLVRIWLAVAALAGWLALAAPAAATGAPLAICVRPALPGQSAAAMFRDAAGFDCRDPQRRRPPGDYWVRADALPAAAAVPGALLRSASVWQDSVTVHVRHADGTVARAGFDSAGAWRFLRLGAWFELPLPPAAAPPVALLWHVRGASGLRGVVLAPSIVTPAQSARQEVRMAALYAGFAGLCIALLIYNMALWGALRHRFQPVYCAMVLCLLLYALSISGLLGQVAGIDNNLRLRINAVALGASALSAMAFARAFFEPRVFAGWLGRSSRGSMLLVGGAVAAYAVLAPWQVALLDRACGLAYLLLLAHVAPILLRAWRCGSRYAGSFALAWGAPVALAGLRALAALGLIGWSFWLDNSTFVAMALEASLGSLAIAYRIKLLSEERDVARAQELLARGLADSDPLTGLLNRRSFLREAIDPEPGRARLLVLVDIDHFKAVNETLGHDGGDEVLRTLARALKAAAPPEALVARLGGEEFAILAPAHLLGLPEAVLAAIRASRMPFDLTVTASIGSELGAIASESDWMRLYRRADQALFAAKSAGRDRARWAVAA